MGHFCTTKLIKWDTSTQLDGQSRAKVGHFYTTNARLYHNKIHLVTFIYSKLN
ncbi:hypothetical protein EVA_05700 [gut metagenome]|uniref:Uncharacterized protein n=1 Tax=gut metagenome TaxID=749906 RepID=J9GFP5_9ZZZZ